MGSNLESGGWASSGLGVFRLNEGGQTAWGHSGWFPPFGSKMFYIPLFELSVAYSASEVGRSRRWVPGMVLVLAYLDNRPDNISMCFYS